MKLKVMSECGEWRRECRIQSWVSQESGSESDGQYKANTNCKTTAEAISWSSLHLRPFADVCWISSLLVLMKGSCCGWSRGGREENEKRAIYE